MRRLLLRLHAAALLLQSAGAPPIGDTPAAAAATSSAGSDARTDTPPPRFDKNHPDAAPTPHSNKVFTAENHASIESCSTHDAKGRAGCEGGGCYWSDFENRCFVRYLPGSEGTYAQNHQD